MFRILLHKKSSPYIPVGAFAASLLTLRLGAGQDGILRKHTMTYSGRIRDTVYFSIVDGEWPVVKTGLEARLRRA